MFRVKRQKFGRNRMLIVTIFLNACTTAVYNRDCPIFPPAGESVAQELENASYADFPKTWEWLGRLNKLKEELDLCLAAPSP